MAATGQAMRQRIADIEARAGARMAAGLVAEADIRHFIELAESMIANLERAQD